MKKKLSSEVLRELMGQGYTAIIGAGQLDNDEILYTPSKEPYDSVIDRADCIPFEESDIIHLREDVIEDLPEQYFEGKEVEIN